MKALGTLLLAGACWGAAAGTAAQAPARWWVGFIDTNDRAFFEIPVSGRDCVERDAAVRRAAAPPAAVVASPRSAATLLPPGARLAFAVADIAGATSERVLTRVVAIVREDEAHRPTLAPACWYLAQAGDYSGAYRVAEDRLAVAVHPPRALRLTAVDATWRSMTAVPAGETAAADDFPAAWRSLLTQALPGAALWHAQTFSAVRDVARGAEPLLLLGAVAAPDGVPDSPATYNTVNLIVREAQLSNLPLYQSGPSGGQARAAADSFVAQVAAVVDLDGDGVDELIIRVRHYAGGNLRILQWDGARYVEVRRTGYEGE
ncbi:MAG: hypothetical protein ACKVQQ_06105 [Burkholderiales bacterium]